MENKSFIFQSAGRFISRGHGLHPMRVIQSWELIYVLSGTLDIFEGERNFRVSAGERLILYPGRRHGGLSAYPPALSFFWVHFLPGNAAMKAKLEKLPQHAHIEDTEMMSAYIQMILSEQRRNVISPDNRVQENISDLVAILIREAAHTKPLPEHADSTHLAESADQFILLHFDEGLSTNEIAEHLQCNPDYLGRVYRNARGITLGTAIRRARIRKALHLLETTGSPIKKIAFESGFNDPAYFRKQFFRECAMTPGQYRKKITREHINTE